MATVIASFVVLVLVVAGMAIGVIFGRKMIRRHINNLYAVRGAHRGTTQFMNLSNPGGIKQHRQGQQSNNRDGDSVTPQSFSHLKRIRPGQYFHLQHPGPSAS